MREPGLFRFQLDQAVVVDRHVFQFADLIAQIVEPACAIVAGLLQGRELIECMAPGLVKLSELPYILAQPGIGIQQLALRSGMQQ